MNIKSKLYYLSHLFFKDRLVEYIQQNHINSNAALKKGSGIHKI